MVKFFLLKFFQSPCIGVISGRNKKYQVDKENVDDWTFQTSAIEDNLRSALSDQLGGISVLMKVKF